MLGFAWSPALCADPTLRFDPDKVTATGVTPDGCTVFFSVAHERVPWLRRTATLAEPRIDDDGDGVVAFAGAPEIADTSVWAAVDIEDGAYALGAPDGYELVEVAVDMKKMTANPGTLVDERPNLELVVIRPRTAAWHGRAFDGAAGDVGAGEDGAVEVRLSNLSPFWSLRSTGKETVLEQLQAGDVVVGIDPIRLFTWSFVYGAQGPISGLMGSAR